MVKNTSNYCNRLLQRFRTDQNGAIAIMFGLVFLILLAASAIALDTSRIQRLRTLTLAALDSASLATAKELTMNGPSGQLETLARSYFDANLRGQNLGEGTYQDFSVQVDPETGTVDISVDFLLKTHIGRVFNVSAFKERMSTRSVYSARDIELGLMLDVSGSMGGSRISALRDASNDLVDIVLENTSSETRNRIGLAPYSNSVNAGTYADAATNGAASSSTCVTERPGSEAFTDASPAVKPLKSRTDKCPTSTVFPLSDDQSLLRSRINALSANGMTAGHLGIAWAWYLVSPEWASFWPSGSRPANYDPRKVLKAVVIMTDGSFNTQYEGSNGNSRYQGKMLCENIKAKGITVFSVGFNAPSDSLDLLSKCATSADYFFNTQSGEELREAFKRIAKELTALRLTG
ncbi:MAG: vWA domain-containing protein [Hyphomicrobiaceae bacterium]